MMSKTAHPSKPIEEMVTSLKTDNTNPIPAKDSALSDAASCISSVDAVCSTKENESDQEAFMAEQSLYYPMNGYYGYPYPGYEMQFGEWNEQCYIVGGQGPAMIQQPLDAGQLVYYSPGFQPGSNSYNNSFVPGPVFGVDGQYLGQQPYGSCPITPQPQPFGSPVYFPHSMCYGPEMMPTYGQDASFWEFNNGNGYTGSFTLPTVKSKYPSKTQPSRHMTANSKSPTVENMGLPQVLDHPPRADLQNPPTKSVNKTFVPSKGFLPLPKSQFYSYQGKSSMLYPSTPSSNKEIGQIWVGADKAKPRSKLNGSGDPDLLNEQNRGPRTNPSRNAMNSGAGVPFVDLEDNPSNKTVLIKKDDYNLSDFPVKYEQAFFFVIKSYSEDDIHKSIKYNVWASTPNGNKRLDGAFQTAQDQMKEKGCACPVFLFFSVNASGQFCGVAEMIGRVDFNKNMDFWQQDKWNGYFPVKWHIIKDVPNPQFRHIILENNDNKPVTNSRDTQEVKFPKGSDMLKIFKYFSSKTSILDDFGFYESRQKVMLDKRAKTSDSPLDNFQQKLEPSNVKRSEESEGTEPIVSSMEALQLVSKKTINNDTQFNVEQ